MTTTDAKRDLPHAFRVAERHRVYVTKDGKPIGGLVSMKMMELLERALAEEVERKTRRSNWPVRVYRLGEEPPEDASSQTPEERIAQMSTLARNAYAIKRAAGK
jgi:thioredoxin-like negative regulator of GroEL